MKNMIPSSGIISCNSFSPPLKIHSKLSSFSFLKSASLSPTKPNYTKSFSKISPFFDKQKRVHFQKLKFSLDTQIPQDPSPISSSEEEKNELLIDSGGNGGGGGGGGDDKRDWTTSFLLFAFWVGIMYYVFFLTPDQTPTTDVYFLKKLLNLKGDDGFKMNEVLVSLWYIMGLWPLVYSMLLLPSARSSKSKIPVWPFLVLSCFGGAYVLIPYFVLWTPPAPAIEESELTKWPLNFLESKLTAGVTLSAGLAIVVYAVLSGGDVWKEFYQYFQGSKFIHVTSLDFSLLSTFAPFWVYNDMTARKWQDKGFWLLPLSLVPFLGPALYLLLRPSLSVVPIMLEPTSEDEK